MSWYPRVNKLLQKCVIFNEAINMHSRGPAEQHFYIWEPHHGCLHKVKKVSWGPLIKEGQRSHKYAFDRANGAIKMENVLVPPCFILLLGIKLWLEEDGDLNRNDRLYSFKFIQLKAQNLYKMLSSFRYNFISNIAT